MAVTYLPGITAAARARNTMNIDTGVVIPQTQYSISPEIYVRNPKAAPVTTLLENLGWETGHDDTYRWKEDELVTQRGVLTGSVLVGAAQIQLAAANARVFTINDVIYFHGYNAQGLVTGVNVVTGVVTITWVVAPVVAIPAGVVGTRIGNANEQVSTHNIGPSTIPVDLSNVYQDMRHGIAASEQHYEDVFLFKPKDWDLQLSKKAEEHEIEKEKTLLVGQQALWQVGASPRGFSQGLYFFCNTNRTSLNAPLTRVVWDNFLTGVMQQNDQPDQDWWALVSGRIASYISTFAQPAERTDTMATQFGMGITVWKSPLAETVKVVRHPLFFREGWDDLCILVNMSRRNIYGVNHTRFATRKYTSIQPRGRSAVEEYFRTIFTECFKGESLNLGVLENVT